MDIVSMPHHLTECGRIYLFLSQNNANFFVISCLFCNNDYSEWLKFYDHLHVHQLEHIQLKQKVKTEEFNLKNEPSKQKIQFEELFTKNELAYEETNVQKPLKNCLGYTKDEFLDEYFTDNYEYNAQIPDAEVSPASITTCFFRLYTTDPEIMLKFIELLRQHPCQWDHKHSNFRRKDKRLDSTLHLTKQLKQNLNINISPQGTRASILSLLRWFDREYIRYINCQQNDFQFVCLHREYFDKLLEFLPHQHLKPMACDECSKHFKSEHLLMAHKHKYHNGQVPFHCRYCGHGFIHQSSYKMHENRHIKIHVWPCRICQYQATSKSDYFKHLTTHSSQRPHKCNICGLAYKTKTNLNVHLKSHSLPDYECEFCKKKFYEKYRYKRHMWQHEAQEMSTKSIDNFTCEICGRRFTSNKTLMKHQLVHIQENYNIEDDRNNFYKLTDVSVYYCSSCSLEFIYKEAYETHMHLKHNVNIR